MSLPILWVIIGTVLLVAEMMTGTVVLVFFALGAFCASLSTLLLPDLANFSYLICALVSVLGFWLLRDPIKTRLLKTTKLSVDVGKEILIDQNIPPYQQARINYQGTTWQANNIGMDEIRQGDRITIVGIDGNILLIRKVN